MPKILNLNTFLLILLIATSYISTGVVGCNSGSGGNNKTTIRGVIEQVIGGTGEVSGIRVSIFENNRRRTSDRTNQSGVFRLTYKPDNDLATIEFEGSDFTLSRVISVTEGSDVTLDEIIDTITPEIIFTEWVVDQRRLTLSSFDQVIFNDTEATFRIDGKNKNCIRAKGESRVEITARSISLINCSEGITTSSFALVDLQADEDINVIANKDGIKSQDNSSVTLSMTNNPVANNIFITSNKENGIRASGSSVVIVDPELNCTITGAKDAIRQSGTSVVDPDGCTLVGN
ncbi:MAG: hypothetical protein E2O72_08545 [Candidatus Dadabacteria bacterium]|nr:MAG: hypothetical protein E2O72_08545 [Candidatus Dadabacteria bacterium]TDJ01276.1 MAG: hypothetical protein E2O70_04020 [Candidatus Dadabacteria bacterium]